MLDTAISVGEGVDRRLVCTFRRQMLRVPEQMTPDLLRRAGGAGVARESSFPFRELPE